MSPESSPDAAGIARRQFNSVRRGYDTKAVRAYLEELSAVVAGLQHQLAEERERAERAEERAAQAEQLDPNRLVELVGEETARVLDSARAAASDIRTKAQESAARLVSEGHDQARAIVEAAESDGEARKQAIVAETAALRVEAAGELDRRRAEGEAAAAEIVQVAEAERRAVEALRAEAEAQAERLRAELRAQAEEEAELVRAAAARDGDEVLERARGEARHLVAEALAVREKLLGDLARRRRSAREQVERLNAARERLLAAYSVIRRTAEEATVELTIALPAARVASDQAARRMNDEPEPSAEDIEAELSTARMAGLVDGDTGADLDVDVSALAEQLGVDASTHLDVPDAASWTAPDPALAPPPPPPPPPPSDANVAGDDEPSPADAPAPHLHLVPPPPPALAPTPEPQEADGEPDAAIGLSELALEDDAPQPDEGPASPPLVIENELVRPDADDAQAGASRAHDAPAEGEVATEPPDVAAEAPPSADASTKPPDVPADAPPAAETAGPAEAPPAVTPSHPPAEPSAPPAGDAVPEPSAEPAGVNGSARPGPHRSVDELFARMRAQQPPPPPAPARSASKGRGKRSAGRAKKAADTTATRAATGTATETEAEPRDRPTTWPTDVERAAAQVSAARGPDAEDEAPDAAVLRRRDAALEGVEALLSRRLKRVLADEENDVLDLLRRGVPESIDEVLPDRDTHVAAYAGAAAPHLGEAAAEGVALVGSPTSGPKAVADGTADRLADQLGAALVDPLRSRVERSVGDGGDPEEVSGRLRALYREWKGQRIGSAARHYAAAAYAAGALDGATEGAEVRWLVDRTGEPCPDADDNALAGTVTKGAPFPTGDRCPPAHPGCRCLVVPAAGVTPAEGAAEGGAGHAAGGATRAAARGAPRAVPKPAPGGVGDH